MAKSEACAGSIYKPAVAALLCLLLLSCAAGDALPETQANVPQRQQTEGRPVLTQLKTGSSLRLLPQSFAAAEAVTADALQLSWTKETGGSDEETFALSVTAAKPLRLRALLLELAYPAQQAVLLDAAGQGSYDAKEVLTLTAGAPWLLQFAAVLPGVDPSSVAAGTELARFRFSADPALLAAARRTALAAGPPQLSSSRAALSYDNEQQAFVWDYSNSGDYDQNGEVNAADMVPLGQHFAMPGPLTAAAELADGNGDGQVNLADITAIGASFGARIEGYRLYTSESGNDYPQDGGGPNGPGSELLGSIALSAAALVSIDDPRLHLRLAPEGHSFSEFRLYWLRPYLGDVEGIASSTLGSTGLKNGFIVDLVDSSFTNNLAERHGATFGEIDISVVSATAETRVNVYLRGASTVRAIEAEMRFDPERYSPLELLAGPHLMNAGEYRLHARRSAGVLHCSAFQRDPSFGSGMNGDVLVCTVRFAHQPESAELPLEVESKVDQDDLPHQLLWHSDSSGLRWLYSLKMDTDHNRQINIADLTYFGPHNIGLSATDPASLAYLCDGNRNGVIEEWDVLWVGSFFKRSITAYEILRSKDPAAYPFGSGAEYFAVVNFENRTWDEQQAGLRHQYSRELALEDRGYYYWLIPQGSDSPVTTASLPSNFVYVP